LGVLSPLKPDASIPFAEQVWQLGDVARYAPCLVCGAVSRRINLGNLLDLAEP